VKTTKRRFLSGLSLVDTMLTTTVLMVAVIGTSHYRYYSALDVQKSDRLITATRIGMMLCESWRGLNGADDDDYYDPTEYFGSELKIIESDGPDQPDDFTLLGSYKIQLNNCNYYATLSWKDVQTGLRALNIIVVWSQRCQTGASLKESGKTFKFTTYTTN